MAKISSFQQFVILLYKGLLLRKRHYVVTFFEIVIPIFIASIFPMILSENSNPRDNYRGDDPLGKDSWRPYRTFSPHSPYNYSGYFIDSAQVVYTPPNNVSDKLIKEAIERFKSNIYQRNINITTHATTSEKELESYCLYTLASSTRIALFGTIFNNFDSNMQDLPISLDYKIRYGSSEDWTTPFYTNQKYRFNGPSSGTQYENSFFMGWQAAVEETFIENHMNKSGKNLDYKVMMQKFPYPSYKDSSHNFSIISMTPMIIGYGYFIFLINLIRRIIEEKSNGSKELMKMMGMSDSVYWTSTFTNYFIVGVITTLVISIIYKAPLKNSFIYLAKSEFFLLFFLLLLYITCSILFCMAFSIFFNKAVFATIAFIVVDNISFSLLFTNYFAGSDQNYLSISLTAKLAICLLPMGNLLTMFRIISFYEMSGEGMNWSSLTSFESAPDLNMLMVMITMVFSCLLYIIIIWYFDKVWPWQPGVPQPFYFLFTKSYWCNTPPKEMNEENLLSQSNTLSADYFEQEPQGILCGVSIQNLSKKFQVGFQSKLAVNNLSLNMYHGQITALLGHNGAGKTTTINILTGLYTPSGGSASINGTDILTDTINARKGLGVCPQHNVLFDTLTVDEHLRIFAGLKGVSFKELSNESLKVLEIMNLNDKRFELVKNLSGGMKRKLSLGNAIVGGSNVLFLDEPTSGLDVEARRSVWDALLNIRRDRTIILTTHYMEEADILGDRIAIMAEGEVQCCGSPMFLKRKFGTGYHLHMVKRPDFKHEETNVMLKKHMPDIVLEKELENELTFKLSSNSGSVLGDMFEEVEDYKEKLGISSCGITITTMEDVFLNVSNLSDMKYSKKNERQLQNGVSMEYEDVYGNTRELQKQNTGNQLFALLEKRFHYTKRFWSILIIQLLLPFLLICLCFTSIKSIQGQFRSIYDPLKLDIKSIYGDSDGFYYSIPDSIPDLTNKVVNALKNNHVTTPQLQNPSQYILDYGKKNLNNYLKKLLVGESVDKYEKSGQYNLTAWYNGEPYHTMPISLLLMHTAILKYVSSDQATISLTNAPLPKIVRQYSGPSQASVESSFAAVFVPLALGFMAATAVLVPIHERATKSQLLQLMTGVPYFLYWVAMFICDYLLHFIVTLLLIIPFAMFYHYVFFGAHSNAIGAALLIMWLYGFSAIPFSYLISLIFKKGNTGFSVVIAITCIIGIALSSIFTAIIPIVLDKPTAKNIVQAIIWIFKLFPPFAVTSGFSNLFSTAYSNAYCDGISQEDLEYNCISKTMSSDNPLFKCCKDICGKKCLQQKSFITWDEKACGRDVLFLALTGILYFSLLIALQTSLFKSAGRLIKAQILKLKKPVRGEISQIDLTNDNDVVAEEQRVHNLYETHGISNTEAMIALDLTKRFKNFYAVHGLSLGIHKEECFGLLGVNGAGKTTTFRMLTGDCYPTVGNAFTNNSSLISDTKKFQSYLGYCPQFDALIDRLTGREMLTLFARLRGLSGSDLKDRVDKLIRMTDLSAHADKQTRFYSGGNKRKLSVGLALIGSPPLILLDEPTAGVDPVSRRKIWNILAQARNFTKAAVILTTHSMEESEALCSRLAIMVNGKFRCLGSIQQLKAKFGQGYTLIIKMKRETTNNPQSVIAIKQHISNRLPSAELKDDHQDMLQYHIIDKTVRLSHLFKFMEESKSWFDLEDYLISDTSLEQIFLTFARAQRITA